MNFHHHLFLHHAGRSPLEILAGSLIGISYVLYFISQLVIIRHNYKFKNYGMPLWGIISLLAVALTCVIGPFTGSYCLFYKLQAAAQSECPTLPAIDLLPHGNPIVLWSVWAASFILQGIMYVQYLVYGKRHQGEFFPELQPLFYPIAILGPLLAQLLCWKFIVFYQDYYVNELFPICVFITACAYLASLKLRPKLRGLSVAAAWLWACSIAMLYIGTMLGGLANPYPDHAATGYGFIELLYWLTIATVFAYAILLQQRKVTSWAPTAASAPGESSAR